MRIGIFINSTKTSLTILEPILFATNKIKAKIKINSDTGMMTFGEALEALKLGLRVKRKPWGEEYLVLIEFGNQANGDRKGGVVKLTDGDFRVIYSYIALSTPDIFLPWSATHVDILEEDWMMV